MPSELEKLTPLSSMVYEANEGPLFPYIFKVNILPEQALSVLSRFESVMLENLNEPAPFAFTNLEYGVTRIELSQAVVWAIP